MPTLTPDQPSPRRSETPRDQSAQQATVEPERWSEHVPLPDGSLARLTHIRLSHGQWDRSAYRDNPDWRHWTLPDSVVAYRLDG